MTLTNYSSKYNNLSLSATFGADSFFYCLWANDLELLSTGHFEEFEEIRANNQINKFVFSSNCLPFTHIPIEEYDENSKSLYLKQIARVENLSNWTFSTNNIGIHGIATVFAYQNKLLQQYNLHTDETKLIHKSSALIWSNLIYRSSEPTVFLNIKEDCCCLTVTKGDQLLFYNQFAYRSNEDILYYIVLIFDQLQLDRNIHSLILSGDVVQDSPLYKLIYNYIVEIKFDDREFICHENIQKPKHFFIDHFALITCV